jgi:hypothetical protein
MANSWQPANVRRHEFGGVRIGARDLPPGSTAARQRSALLHFVLIHQHPEFASMNLL